MFFRKLAAGLLLAFVIGPQVSAKVFLKLEEALAQAYPSSRRCKTEPQNRYLTTGQLKKASELAGTAIPSALVVRYAAICEGKPAGFAYTDTHRVRTHPETIFIAVGPGDTIDAVEVLSFDEPLDYIPRGQWYGTFKKQKLDVDLQVKRAIPFVTGASLTSRATTEAVRRALAVNQVLKP